MGKQHSFRLAISPNPGFYYEFQFFFKYFAECEQIENMKKVKDFRGLTVSQ